MDNPKSVWKALADPTRRKILDILREHPNKAGRIAEAFPISREGVTKHLKILKDANLVIDKKKGRENWYYLNVIPLEEMYERWMHPYEKIWSSSLLKLKKQLEQGDNDMDINFMEIELKVFINATREKVFNSLVTNVSHWWGRPFIINEQTTNIILEPKIGGLFYETWDNVQGYKWGEVTHLKTNEVLELTGSFGMPDIVHSKVKITLEDENNGTGTNLFFSHQAMGPLDEKNKTSYAGGWKDLIGTRLKVYVEEGIKMGLGHEPPMEVSV